MNKLLLLSPYSHYIRADYSCSPSTDIAAEHLARLLHGLRQIANGSADERGMLCRPELKTTCFAIRFIGIVGGWRVEHKIKDHICGAIGIPANLSIVSLAGRHRDLMFRTTPIDRGSRVLNVYVEHTDPPPTSEAIRAKANSMLEEMQRDHT